MRKAFTLLEILFSIIILGGILYLSVVEYSKNDWLSSVNKFNDDVYQIIDKGVMSNITGYLNTSGGYCSSSPHYTGITAERVIGCNDWKSTYPCTNTNGKVCAIPIQALSNINNISKDGTQSYIHGLLRNYTQKGDGCKLYIDDKNSVSFYYFIDCSNVNYDGGSARYKRYLEDKILSFARENFSTLFKGANRQSTSVDNALGGTDDDGKIRILIKK